MAIQKGFFVETKTDAAEHAGVIGWVTRNVMDALETMRRALEADPGAGMYMIGPLVMAQENLDSMLGEVRELEKVIKQLDPPRQLTDEEIKAHLREMQEGAA